LLFANDFNAILGGDSKERADGTDEIAEFRILPVPEALDNVDRQWFAGGEDDSQHGGNAFAKRFHVREMAPPVVKIGGG
jgi:hypothetical protein